MMPAGSAGPRSEVMGELSLIVHELETTPDMAELIDRAESEDLNNWQKANVREMKRIHKHATAIPGDLVTREVKATSEAHMVWRDARAANDFAALAPKLDVVFDLIKETAQIKAEAFGVSEYEALLDSYDPGRKEEKIDEIFDDLAGFLPGFLGEVLERQASGPDAIWPEGPFPDEQQYGLSKRVMEVIGFPFDHGRLDVSHHPFCGGASGDIRITTRYDNEDFIKCLMAVVHETGHALYENGLPLDWRGQPVGTANGMTLHESQSLLLEMQAARSEEFIGFLAPLVRDQMNGSGPAWEGDNLTRIYRNVGRGLIRVDADEITYPLHIILRYRLEKEILAGDVTTKELPGVWNDMMQELVGITPPDDADGVMQDTHWPSGLFGYFPTYSLGAMTAAQLFQSAKKSDPNILPSLGEGDFTPLFAWLNENIREQGSLYTPDELIKRASGVPLSADAFKSHLQERYLAG